MGKKNCVYVFMNVSASWNIAYTFSPVQKLQINPYWFNVEFKRTMLSGVSSPVPMSSIYIILQSFILVFPKLSELVAANEI